MRLEENFTLVILPRNTHQITKVLNENFKMQSLFCVFSLKKKYQFLTDFGGQSQSCRSTSLDCFLTTPLMCSSQDNGALIKTCSCLITDSVLN